MKKTILSFLIATVLNLSYGQSINQSRTAELTPETYSITGDAFLEAYDNGDLKLRISDDFDTPSGPDVRVYLNNSVSTNGAVEIANLSNINHFNGEITFDIDDGIDIDDYDFIVFFCFQFSQLWASGEFGEVTNGDFQCESTSVSNANGNDDIDICPSDGSSDIVSFENDLNLDSGDHYAYLITDDNEILEMVILEDSYDFEGSTNDEQRVYGIHYNGILDPEIGLDRAQTTASGCYQHTNSSNYISVTKNACTICENNEVENPNGSNSINICPDDGIVDEVAFANNLNLSAGSHYAYLITNVNQIVEIVVYENEYNFEGSSENTQRVYGVHYDGNLNVDIGSHRDQTTGSVCHIHSDNDHFITINKDECAECSSSDVTSTNGNNVFDICPSDNSDDIVEFQNSLDIQAGDNYAYLITNVDQILQNVVFDDEYNFEGSSEETQRVYGISYDGNLNIEIGENRLSTTSSGCITHSDTEMFITILKNNCTPEFECNASLTATTDWANTVDICPTDGLEDIVELRNNISASTADHYAYLRTDENENLIQVISDSTFDFESSSLETERIYGIHFDGELIPIIGTNRIETTASGCFTHSGDNIFLTITKNGCEDIETCVESLTASINWATNLDLCSTDGIQDSVLFQNNVSVAPGDTYAFLMTDSTENLVEVVIDSFYNFEGNGIEERRIYGISYNGILDVKIGEPRQNTTASICQIHSGGNLFITINPTAACSTSIDESTEISQFVNIYPNPSSSLVNIEAILEDKIDQISLYGINGTKVKDLTTLSNFEIEESGLYFVRIQIGAKIFTQKIVIY